MSSASYICEPAERQRVRTWPIWEPALIPGMTDSDDLKAIEQTLSDFFWDATSHGLSALMDDIITIATDHADIDLLSLAEACPDLDAPLYITMQNYDDRSNDEKALNHLARSLLQASGLFDLSVVLESRGDRLGTGIEGLDWLLTRPGFRFLTRKPLYWGNAHASILYGPLRFETGIKTDECSLSGVLVTSRYNELNSGHAFRLLLEKGKLQLEKSDLNHPPGSLSHVRTHPPFAVIKEVIDAIFVHVSSMDHHVEVVHRFVRSTLQYYRAKGVLLHSSKVGDIKRSGLKKVVDTLRREAHAPAFPTLVKDRIGAFIQLVATDTDLLRWNALGKNCQHFCSEILKSRCFVRQQGYDSLHGRSSLPSTDKVLFLLDDQSPRVSPWFAEYFNSVVPGESGTMVSFRESDLKKSMDQQPARASLLDLRQFGIPILPSLAEHSKNNAKLGVSKDASVDAWFALSAISLYFVAPADLPLDLADKLDASSRYASFGRLALGYQEWLEIALTPQLMDTIGFAAVQMFTIEQRAAIAEEDGKRYVEMRENLETQLAKANRKAMKESRNKRKWKDVVKDKGYELLALKACRDIVYNIPKARERKRGTWDWLETLG